MKMKYTEQAVETLDDAGSVIANKNIEIEQLRQRVQELEKERDNWKQSAQNNHDRLVDVQAELELSDALQRDKVAKLTAERDEATQACGNRPPERSAENVISCGKEVR